MLSNGIHIGRRGGVRLSGGGGDTPWWLAGDIDPAVVVAAYQPKGAASLAASYVNLANPGTNDAAPVVAPTFAAATGWTFNGSTQYLTTGIVPDGNTSMLVRFSDTTGNVVAGVSRTISGSNQGWFYIIPAGAAKIRWRYGATFANGSAAAPAAGVVALAGGIGYLNGVVDKTAMPWVPSQTGDIVIGALREITGSTSINSFFVGKVQAFMVANTTLTAGQVAALSAAMDAL